MEEGESGSVIDVAMGEQGVERAKGEQGLETLE